MRALVQRVSNARVSVGGEAVGSIGPGVLVFLGVDLEKAAVGALTHRDHAVDARAINEPMARGDVVARAHDDAMAECRAEAVGRDIGAAGQRHDLRPQRRYRFVSARDATLPVVGFDRRLQRQPAVQIARCGHSATMR